ncbi:MAG TPA: argininosuccinate lyase, partial [Anaerovibrio sp.]|nr:argininosuccinate lyase [Anaerovibrio sp.]
HLQRAQPVLFSHHMMAYFSMLKRDFDRFVGVYERCDIMPLGAGALAGTTFPIDRKCVAEQLNFENIYSNSLDAVSDRDYIMEFLSAASILMVHLSRLSEETILWCSREFFFIELDDAHCTGSSMMPQKKNPDVSELVRGKTGRVVGHLMAMLSTVKGLPLAYNKDLQEDKEGIFDTIDTIKFSLAVYARILRGMKVRPEVMRKAVAEDFSNATDLADYLVKKGMPFRQAHAVSGKAVHHCIEESKWLSDMSMTEFKELSNLFEEDIYDAISPETCVKNRNSYGGTSYSQVEMQLQQAHGIMDLENAVVEDKINKQVTVKS